MFGSRASRICSSRQINYVCDPDVTHWVELLGGLSLSEDGTPPVPIHRLRLEDVSVTAEGFPRTGFRFALRLGLLEITLSGGKRLAMRIYFDTDIQVLSQRHLAM